MAELQNPLPPGWDCQKDPLSGKYYYINHYTKTTTWEHPSARHRHVHTSQKQNYNTEYIPLQHGTPELRRNYVYPRQTSPIPAFQMPTHNMSPKSVPLQDLRPKVSPLTVRSKVQDSSLSITSESEDILVGKIAGMFPTVPETHIRMLFKNCRYMKSIFPKADEVIILEVLQNNENNIQKTSEILKDMGYERKDTVKILQSKIEEQRGTGRTEDTEIVPGLSPPRIRTAEEKQTIKTALQGKYKDVAEHLIYIALESVNFEEERANQILQIMIQEDNKNHIMKKNHDDTDSPSTSNAANIPVSLSRQSLKSVLKAEKELDINVYSRVVEQNNSSYISPNLSTTRGPNPEYARGANEKLLLTDYIEWQGHSSSLTKGSQKLARGPNPTLLSERSHQSLGSNRNLVKGPQCGLAQGSIFTQFKTAVVVGESRD